MSPRGQADTTPYARQPPTLQPVDIRRLLGDGATPSATEQELASDAARLYDQGWSIRQVAEKFDYSYGAMRRILGKHITLRNRGTAGETH